MWGLENRRVGHCIAFAIGSKLDGWNRDCSIFFRSEVGGI